MTPQQYASAYENGGYRQTLSRLKRQGIIAHEEAEDLAQTTWLRALVRLGQVRDDGRFGGWVAVIEMNQLRTAFRARRFEQLLGINEPAGTLGISVAGIDVRRAIERCCSSRQKELLDLVYVDGFSSGEAAGELGMSVAAVHQELTRARAAMREYLTPTYRGPRREESVCTNPAVQLRKENNDAGNRNGGRTSHGQGKTSPRATKEER